MPILTRPWYNRPGMLVARELLGKILVTETQDLRTSGRIVEVEAYFGAFDKASHAYPMRRTERTSIMFKEGGHAYVFRCHTHWQFNVVANGTDIPDCILVRALEPLEGKEIMRERRGREDLTSGPGKLCAALGIDKSLYGADLTHGDAIWIEDDGHVYDDTQILCAPRVGIHYAEEFVEEPWRFYVQGSPWVSKVLRDAPTFHALRRDLLK